jgi:hypothetical protein
MRFKGGEGGEAEDVVREIRHNMPVEFFKTVGRSFWPPAYRDMALLTMRRVLSYFFWLILLSYGLMILAGIPAVYFLKGNIDSALTSFDAIAINSSIRMNRELYVPQLGVGIDTREGSNLSYEMVLVTDNEIQVRSWVCNFLPVCGLLKEPYTPISLDTVYRPTQNREAFINLVFGLVIFLIPSILATILVFIFLKYIAIALVLWVLGMLLLRLFNRRLRIDRIFKVGVFAMSPLILIETINLPYARELFYIPAAITLVFYVMGLLFASERGSKSY